MHHISSTTAPSALVAIASLLLCSLAQAWQTAPAGYPATNYPATNYPAANYPTAGPGMAGAGNPTYPQASGYPQTPVFDRTVQGGLPATPFQPQATVQPNNWPGAVASDTAAQPQNYPVTNAGAPPHYPRTDAQGPIQATRASAEILQKESHVLATNVQILATVASDPILASDVLPYVDDVFNANKDQIPPEQREKVRTQLIMQRVKSLIDTKTVCNNARQHVPKENMKTVEKKINEVFEDKEVPQLMKKAGCSSRSELAEKMKQAGTSLDRERQSFFEATLAKQWLGEQVRTDTSREITHDEMLTWYRDHADEYEVPARARWQQLFVRRSEDRYSNKSQQKIWDLGNMVVVQGVPFAEVAKKLSEGPTAAEGGVRDWTSRGSLVSRKLDETLFTLEIGKMSPVIEDDTGYHIVMVLEREPPGRVPFLDAQVGIKDKIKKERQQASVKEFLTELKKTTPVWTIFDDQKTASAAELGRSGAASTTANSGASQQY